MSTWDCGSGLIFMVITILWIEFAVSSSQEVRLRTRVGEGASWSKPCLTSKLLTVSSSSLPQSVLLLLTTDGSAGPVGHSVGPSDDPSVDPSLAILKMDCSFSSGRESWRFRDAARTSLASATELAAPMDDPHYYPHYTAVYEGLSPLVSETGQGQETVDTSVNFAARVGKRNDVGDYCEVDGW